MKAIFILKVHFFIFFVGVEILFSCLHRNQNLVLVGHYVPGGILGGPSKAFLRCCPFGQCHRHGVSTSTPFLAVVYVVCFMLATNRAKSQQLRTDEGLIPQMLAKYGRADVIWTEFVSATGTFFPEIKCSKMRKSGICRHTNSIGCSPQLN